MAGLIVDLFAGGGGASTGLTWALGRSPDIAINHNAEALAMHAANHPHTRHLQNDITRVLPLTATGGRSVAILHASPDCTHFSKAKGGKPKSQYIRDLAWVVIRWAEDTHPMLITLENVEEFLTWGPLDKAGQPIKERKGDTFRAWVRRLRRLGYRVDWRELRACDYGAPTTRKRLFIVARRDKQPIIWPTPTHGDPKSSKVRAGKLLPWRTAAECIDWTLQGRSIFDRKKPLALNTQRRIAEGVRRYVLNSPEPFIVTYYGQKKLGDFRGQDLARPLPTQTTENRFGLVVACVTKHYGGIVGHELGRPLGTVTTIDHHALTTTTLIKYYGAGGGSDVNAPLHTVTSKDRMGLVCAELNADGARYVQTRDWLRLWGVIGPDAEAEVAIRGAIYRITDISMRMLAPRELYSAQGFPADYIIDWLPDGTRLTKTAQVRMCGNSVPPQLIAAVVKANDPETWIEETKSHLPLLTLAPEWGIAKAVNA